MVSAQLVAVKELLEVTQQVAQQETLAGPCQRKNMSSLVRRVRLLLPVLEEVRDNKVLLPPSAVVAFKELHSIMVRVTEIFDELRSSSQLWLLAECKVYGNKLFQVSQDMVRPLFSLPLSLLELPIELKEQVELLKVQVRRSKLCVDPAEEILHEELLSLLDELEKNKAPTTDRIEALFKQLLLSSSKDCLRELQQLNKIRRVVESPRSSRSRGLFTRKNSFSSSTSARIQTLQSLVKFICYSSCVLYGMVADVSSTEEDSTGTDDDESEEEDEEKQVVASFIIPDEFKCPISLELMKDPVIMATGQTYDRASIQRWVEAGNLTCPKSGQKLIHMTLIPNFALRSLIAQWCEKHRIPFVLSEESKGAPGVDHIANAQAAVQAAKMTASFLVGKLAMGTPEIQKQAAYELRLLAKSGMENRRCIAEAGAIPFLVSLLLSRDATTQENAITALLNISIFENNKILIMTAGALEPITTVLTTGHTNEARENAAATIFSLSTVDENKVAIGKKESIIPALVELLRDGSQTGKKDAVSALFNLSLLSENKERVVSAGAVGILVDGLESESQNGPGELVENSLALLGLLAMYEPGARAIAMTSAMKYLVRLVENGSQRQKENAAAVLLAMCKSKSHPVLRSLMAVPGSISALHGLLANGSSRARRKAGSLMKILHAWDPSSSCHVETC